MATPATATAQASLTPSARRGASQEQLTPKRSSTRSRDGVATRPDARHSMPGPTRTTRPRSFHQMSHGPRATKQRASVAVQMCKRSLLAGERRWLFGKQSRNGPHSFSRCPLHTLRSVHPVFAHDGLPSTRRRVRTASPASCLVLHSELSRTGSPRSILSVQYHVTPIATMGQL